MQSAKQHCQQEIEFHQRNIHDGKTVTTPNTTAAAIPAVEARMIPKGEISPE